MEACIFTLHEPKYVSSTELSDEEAKAENYTVEIADRFYRIVDVESKSTWDSKLRLLNISNVLYNIEDLLEEQFGENAEVIITRDEIIVNEYDCGY